MTPDQDSTGSDDSGIALSKLRPALPGERYFWALFLAVFASSPLWAIALGVYYGYVDPNVVLDVALTFAPDISFVGEFLGWILVGTIAGTVLYAFARLTGVAFLAGVINFVDALIDGYSSPRLTVEEDDETE